MNLLARILSHGFAIAIVVLLAIGLIYRGELFPDGELPEFLSFGTTAENGDTPADAPEETTAAATETEAEPVMQAGAEDESAAQAPAGAETQAGPAESAVAPLLQTEDETAAAEDTATPNPKRRSPLLLEARSGTVTASR